MYLCKEQESKHEFKLKDSLACEKDLVSAIIPVYAKKASSLPECLNNVYGQDYEKIEVIIVNNGINKGEIDSALSSFRYKNLKIIHTNKNMGASYGRNEGAFHSKGEFLWFVDSDVYKIDSKTLSFSVQMLKERDDIGAIGGQCSEVGDAEYLFMGRQSDMNFKENKEKYKLFEDEYVNTCNLVMRRKDFMEINGFTDFIEYIQDDLDFGYKIRKSGLKCVLDYRAVAYHPFLCNGWDNSQLWMFYKNSILFYIISYSFSELLGFLFNKYAPSTKSKINKDSRQDSRAAGGSLIIKKLNRLRIFFSAALFLAVRAFSVIKQRNKRQKLLRELREKSGLRNAK
ncbi:MAG: glycosyltransferase family 2 protein [Candidatus Omnitrophota bacterium]